MSVDKDKLVNEAMKNDNVSALLGDKQKLMSVLGSAEGKQLIAMLSKDGGKALQKAAGSLASGDAEGAKNAILPMIDEDGEQLLEKINKKVKG